MKENIKNLLNYIHSSEVCSGISAKFKFLPAEYTSEGNNLSAAECDSQIYADNTDSIINILYAVIFTMEGLSNYSIGKDSFIENRISGNRRTDYTESEKHSADQQSTDMTMSPVYKNMLDAGRKNCAFRADGNYNILKASGPLLAVLRSSADSSEKVLCLLNISGRILKLFTYWNELDSFKNRRLYDIINTRESDALTVLAAEKPAIKRGTEDSEKSNTGSECSAMINLDPWEVVWLK